MLVSRVGHKPLRKRRHLLLKLTAEWPDFLPAVQVRVARPTVRLQDVVRFYRDGLGLRIIGSFEGHAGYSGVMLGLPDRSYHLEFTEHVDGSPCPAPSKDNLLVFYLPDGEASTDSCAE